MGLGFAYISVADISRRQHVLHLAWLQELLELLRDRGCPLRNVDVSDDERELSKVSLTMKILLLRVD